MRVYQDAVGMIRNVQRKWPRSKESFTEIEIRLGKALGGKSFRPGVCVVVICFGSVFDVLSSYCCSECKLCACMRMCRCASVLVLGVCVLLCSS